MHIVRGIANVGCCMFRSLLDSDIGRVPLVLFLSVVALSSTVLGVIFLFRDNAVTIASVVALPLGAVLCFMLVLYVVCLYKYDDGKWTFVARSVYSEKGNAKAGSKDCQKCGHRVLGISRFDIIEVSIEGRRR